jgi:hypothetical protein
VNRKVKQEAENKSKTKETSYVPSNKRLLSLSRERRGEGGRGATRTGDDTNGLVLDDLTIVVVAITVLVRR